VGRTVLPITLVLRQEEESWKEFRRALRKEDRELLDGIFASARYHSAACSLAARPLPMEAVLVCVLLEQRRELAALSHRLAEAERRLGAAPAGASAPPAAGEAPPEGDGRGGP
jgi:hypothetical protein